MFKCSRVLKEWMSLQTTWLDLAQCDRVRWCFHALISGESRRRNDRWLTNRTKLVSNLQKIRRYRHQHFWFLSVSNYFECWPVEIIIILLVIVALCYTGQESLWGTFGLFWFWHPLWTKFYILSLQILFCQWAYFTDKNSQPALFWQLHASLTAMAFHRF